jgi:hypothetical protein
MHGPTRIFWANLTAFSLQYGAAPADALRQSALESQRDMLSATLDRAAAYAAQAGRMPTFADVAPLLHTMAGEPIPQSAASASGKLAFHAAAAASCSR